LRSGAILLCRDRDSRRSRLSSRLFRGLLST
jgi:hypothetical protein